VNKNISLLLIAITIAVVNVIGILLKYFGLDTFLILFGFRFQLSLILPLLLFIRKEQKDFYINIFKYPSYKKNIFYIYLFIIPFLVLFVILFLLKEIELGDPEYLYEFGISSIIDFPVYLVWNSIQLVFFFLFLITLLSKFKFSFFLLIFILLFAYEFVELKKEKIDYYQLISILLFAINSGIMIKYFQNIYWLVIFSFSVLWFNVILFGTNNETIINILFASHYNSWEGFFSVSKSLKSFLLPAYLFIADIFLLLGLMNKKES
jgi:hypothetical protein